MSGSDRSIRERVAETSHVAPELQRPRPPFPKKAKVEITSRCDLRCFFCQHTYDTRPHGDIDPELLTRLLVELRDMGVEELGLFWIGEPFLNTSLPDYVRQAKALGFPYVFVTTNGRLATPDRIAAVFDAGLDSIKFSFNADNRESYLRVCGVDGFDRSLENLRAAWEFRGTRQRPRIYASTVQMPGREREYEQARILIEPYVDQHYPLRLYGQQSLAPDGQVVPASPSERRRIEDMLPCWPLFTEPHISFDGFMSACYCDHDPRLYMADVKTMSVLDAWHADKFATLRQHHLAGDVRGTVCGNCVACP